MPWDANSAARAVWEGFDKNATNGDALRYLAEQLQVAYDYGVAERQESIMDKLRARHGETTKQVLRRPLR